MAEGLNKILGGIKMMNENCVSNAKTSAKASEVEEALARLGRLTESNSEAISRIQERLVFPKPSDYGKCRPDGEHTLAYIINAMTDTLENDSEVLKDILTTINRQLGDLKLE